MEALDKESVDFAWKAIKSNHPLRKLSVLKALSPTVKMKHLFGLDKQSKEELRAERRSNIEFQNEDHLQSNSKKQKDAENIMNRISKFTGSIFDSLLSRDVARSDDVSDLGKSNFK